MKNLSQRKKLLLMFLVISIIPICFVASISAFSSLYIIRETSTELLEGRLSQDIDSAQLYLDSYVGSIQKQDNQLIAPDGSDLAANTELINQISEKLDEQVSIYIKQGDSFYRYLTSIKDASTGDAIINTELDPSTDTYRTVIADNTYVGTIDLLDVTYISAYQPLKNESGETIGLLSVAISTQTIQDMAMEHIHNLSAISEENAAAAEEASACIEEQGASLVEISNDTSALSQMSDELAQMIQKFRI